MEPRRSARLTTYDSNGRDALAGDLGWTRGQLEAWITSDTVRPHIQTWYRMCVEGERRFNDGVDWINTGDRGYYYNPHDLEEDVFLTCLGEGLTADDIDDTSMGFAVEDAQTGEWLTQDLWARTAWRIVHANVGPGQVFEQRIKQHTAFCYAFTIDMLCIAFHSIAFRSSASCYRDLIIGATKKEKTLWTAKRAAWVEKHGEEDSKVESVKSSYSDSSIFDEVLSLSEGSEHLGSEESDTSSGTTIADNSGLSRTLAALRQQKKHDTKALGSGKAVPLSSTGLMKHTTATAKTHTSKKKAVGKWLNKLDRVHEADVEISVSSDEEEGTFSSPAGESVLHYWSNIKLTILPETPDVDVSEASTIILPSKKRVAPEEEVDGENNIVAANRKRVKLADVHADDVKELRVGANMQLATPGGTEGRRLRKRVQRGNNEALVSPESMKVYGGRR